MSVSGTGVYRKVSIGAENSGNVSIDHCASPQQCHVRSAVPPTSTLGVRSCLDLIQFVVVPGTDWIQQAGVMSPAHGNPHKSLRVWSLQGPRDINHQI
jgi:hypothetical protein